MIHLILSVGLGLSLASACWAQLVRYEAENATLSGGASVASNANASGGKFVKIGWGDGSRIDFTVTVPRADKYLMRIAHKSDGAKARRYETVDVNGVTQTGQQYACGYFWVPGTNTYNGDGELDRFNSFKGALTTYGDSDEPWQISQRWWENTGGNDKRNNPMEIPLNAGSNKISIKKSWGGSEWDYIEVDTSYPSRELNISFTINTGKDVAPISPLIYGSSLRFDIADDALTMMRFGGNLTTPYNWENNFTNAGHDWHHSNSRIGWPDGIMPSGRQTEPGVALTYHHDRCLTRGFEDLLPVSMIGYVANDGNGEVSEAETAPSKRWKQTKYKKGAPFCNPPGKPDTSDAFVYSDELVNYLVSKYGNASTPRGVKHYVLDNEPRLWSSNHVRIHPDTLTGGELISKSTQLATAIKDVDPYAKIFGPAFYGIWPMYDLQNKSDWEKIKKDYSWFVDYYLDEMKKASDAYGKRLVDIFTFHHYFGTSSQEARMQEPRSLWDKDFKADPLLVRIQKSIDKYFPGTRIAITEWSYGGDSLISGGIATADLLGIYGKMGLYQASYWTLDKKCIYQIAAYRLFRNYDGKKSTFGDTKVFAETNDNVSSSLYASTFTTKPGQISMVVLNKNMTKEISGTFTISGPDQYKSGRVWAFDNNSTSITERTPVSGINNNVFSYTIPALTACHIVLQADSAANNNPIRKMKASEMVSADKLHVSSTGETTRISFKLDKTGFVRLEMYNLGGKLVKRLIDSELDRGSHDHFIDRGCLLSGIYTIRLVTEQGDIAKHLVIKN